MSPVIGPPDISLCTYTAYSDHQLDRAKANREFAKLVVNARLVKLFPASSPNTASNWRLVDLTGLAFQGRVLYVELESTTHLLGWKHTKLPNSKGPLSWSIPVEPFWDRQPWRRPP